jgi:hypothetical protein
MGCLRKKPAAKSPRAATDTTVVSTQRSAAAALPITALTTIPGSLPSVEAARKKGKPTGVRPAT